MQSPEVKELFKFEDELSKIDEEYYEKIKELRKEREAKRSAVLKKRKEPVNRLQNFWAEALINHMIIGELISDEDMEILEFMSSMNVEKEQQENDEETIKIIFNFAKNPYLSNDSLEKIIKTKDDVGIKSSHTPIQWKGEGADRNRLSDSATQSHFFEWFEDDSLPGSDFISEVIYKDLFYYPTKWYVAEDLDSDEVMDNRNDDDGLITIEE